jgi:hypothetical protein
VHVTRRKRPRSSRATALAFAGFLDARRFCEAERCLAFDCLYEPAGAPRILGAAAIIQSYRDNDAAGTEQLDELRYTSHVEGVDAETVTVEFTDYLRVGDQTLTFVSRQKFVVREGLIHHIVGQETSDQRRQLEEFLAASGVRRRSSIP